MNFLDESAIRLLCLSLSESCNYKNKWGNQSSVQNFSEKFISGFDSTHFGRLACLSMGELSLQIVSASSNRSTE